MPPAGGVADGFPRTVEEGSVAKLEEETTLPEDAGDWVGRLAAGSVGFKMTVEMTVIVTTSPAAESVACGISPEMEERCL